MRVLVTGASGFIGSAVVQELQQAGHEVWGLARSNEVSRQLRQRGVRVQLGNLEDPHSLSQAAAAVDGVIHTAFLHTLGQMSWAKRLQIFAGGRPSQIGTRFAETLATTDRLAIQALGAGLGSGQPLLACFATLALQPGHTAQESDPVFAGAVGAGRGLNEHALHQLTARGVITTAVRLPPLVHGEGDQHGLLPQLIHKARQKKRVAYLSTGQNRWPAVHRLDAARLLRLALEAGHPQACYHAVAEEGIPFQALGSQLAQRLDLPLLALPDSAAAGYFGWLSGFVGVDNPVSSRLTQDILGWRPTEPDLFSDLSQADYF